MTMLFITTLVRFFSSPAIWDFHGAASKLRRRIIELIHHNGFFLAVTSAEVFFVSYLHFLLVAIFIHQSMFTNNTTVLRRRYANLFHLIMSTSPMTTESKSRAAHKFLRASLFISNNLSKEKINLRFVKRLQSTSWFLLVNLSM